MDTKDTKSQPLAADILWNAFGLGVGIAFALSLYAALRGFFS